MITEESLKTEKQLGSLSGADLRYAILRYADLSGADLRYAILNGANLSGADLNGAILNGAILNGANLNGANLRCADLSGADLSGADLSGADLSDADLSGADLSGAILRYADLSGAKGIPTASRILDQLEKTTEGLIVYKTFNEHYNSPANWEGSTEITEVCDLLPTVDCGCGINVGTFEYVKKKTDGQIWKCLLKWEDLIESVVPYNSDGKFRCSRLIKLEPVDRP